MNDTMNGARDRKTAPENRQCPSQANRAEQRGARIASPHALPHKKYFRKPEESKMKANIYNAAKNIYSKNERLNIAPVAFAYVPKKNRG